MQKEKRIHIDEKNAIEKVSETISSIPFHQDMIILCIGTDRSTGDALGPLVGTFLKEVGIKNPIYGTIENPVHALNLTKSITEIRESHPLKKIIAVDACLGKKPGNISIGRGILKPGEAVSKNLPEIGDYYIKGIVNFSGYQELLVLQSTRLSLVFKMAKTIAQGISDAKPCYQEEIKKMSWFETALAGIKK